MRYVTILQVGDVHYPDHQKPHADLKDRKLAPALVEASTASELQASTRALLKAMAEYPEAVLTFAGDLTSKGELEGYEACVKWLAEALRLGPDEDLQADQLQVVPGNHDVNRELAAVAGRSDILDKFLPLSTTWSDLGLAVLASHSPRPLPVGDGDPLVITYGLNSCIGCGERRDLPPDLRSAVEEALRASGVDATHAGDALETAIAHHAEVIDAPAFHEEHIETIYTAIEEQPPESVAVLIAHHNLLQQAQPRLDLYTDLLNAGMVRSRLSSLDVPIIYLHGHIHDDPIEIVSQAAPDSGQLVCISAPEFRDGFNRIDIAFSSNKVPIGCIVHRYRVRLHGGTTIEQPIRIRFHTYERVLSEAGMSVLEALIAKPNCSNLADLRSESETLNALSDNDLASAVDEVEWLELLEVLNRDKAPKSWRIRAVMSRE